MTHNVFGGTLNLALSIYLVCKLEIAINSIIVNNRVEEAETLLNTGTLLSSKNYR